MVLSDKPQKDLLSRNEGCPAITGTQSGPKHNTREVTVETDQPKMKGLSPSSKEKRRMATASPPQVADPVKPRE